MSELLKSINTRVVGVSFQNDDGTDRQEILSGLSVGEAMLLKYFEYENEPAYAVTDAIGNRIGSLSKELSADIYRKYKDCFFAVQISDITGGDYDRKYGCIIDIDIYDTVPDVVKQNTSTAASVENVTPAAPKYSLKSYKTYGLILIVLGVIISLVGLLLMLVSPVGGIFAIVFGVLSFIIGRKYRNTANEHRDNI